MTNMLGCAMRVGRAGDAQGTKREAAASKTYKGTGSESPAVMNAGIAARKAVAIHVRIICRTKLAASGEVLHDFLSMFVLVFYY